MKRKAGMVSKARKKEKKYSCFKNCKSKYATEWNKYHFNGKDVAKRRLQKGIYIPTYQESCMNSQREREESHSPGPELVTEPTASSP